MGSLGSSSLTQFGSRAHDGIICLQVVVVYPAAHFTILRRKLKLLFSHLSFSSQFRVFQQQRELSVNAMFDTLCDGVARFLKGTDVDNDQIISAKQLWKAALWDPNDINATMIRVPACLIFFLFLWCIDLFIMDVIQLSYYQVLGLKQHSGSPFVFVMATSIFYGFLYGFHMTFICQFMGIDAEYGVLTFYYPLHHFSQDMRVECIFFAF